MDMLQRDEWIQKKLTLPEDDRAYVADALEQSLRPSSLAPDVAQAWSEEIDRRIAAYDSGEKNAIDFTAAIQHMQQALSDYQ
jgi:hypothetical protein